MVAVRLPDLGRPLAARTARGEVVRIRAMVDGEPRVDASSEYDDWGTFDVPVEELVEGRAMVEVLRADAAGKDQWEPVGDMSWEGHLHGPNLGSRAVSIGIALEPAARGRGIGAVAQGLLATAMHAAGVHRVEASTDVANVAEQRSLRRAGFVAEGVLRAAQVRADGRHDLALFSCLPGEPRVHPDGADGADRASAAGGGPAEAGGADPDATAGGDPADVGALR